MVTEARNFGGASHHVKAIILRSRKRREECMERPPASPWTLNRHDRSWQGSPIDIERDYDHGSGGDNFVMRIDRQI